ncbi:MAG: EamA family transporter [Gammaproteobacteria bacterium]|nr:EamA family transporter [Gammaproteobacteria bacterium]
MVHDPTWRLKVVLAFAAVYLIWGSTYLAIRVGVAELPPALFAGVRFVIAGLLLSLYAGWCGQKIPRAAREWKYLGVTAVLLFVVANGLVVWGEQWVPSSQTALIVATTALWLAGIGTLGSHGNKLARGTVLGLAIGFFGVAVLLLPTDGFVLDHFWAQLALLAAALSWAVGSIYLKRAKPATPPLMSAAMQSLIAGAVLCVIGVSTGEIGRWGWSPDGLVMLAYLAVFGSCFGYAAYAWLLHEVNPAMLGTYAYVNPAVAVVLGWWLLDETLSTVQFSGMAVILAGVVLVTTSKPKAIVPTAQRG